MGIAPRETRGHPTTQIRNRDSGLMCQKLFENVFRSLKYMIFNRFRGCKFFLYSSPAFHAGLFILNRFRGFRVYFYFTFKN